MGRRRSIDVSDIPELRRVAEAARERNDPIVLRAGDRDIAIVTAIPPATDQPTSQLTREQIDAVMSAAGSWDGIIDVDEFLKEIYASRGSTRPPVDV